MNEVGQKNEKSIISFPFVIFLIVGLAAFTYVTLYPPPPFMVRQPKAIVAANGAPELSASLQKVIRSVSRAENLPGSPIVFIQFKDGSPTDRELEEASAISTITEIMCASPNLTDQGLKYLTKLPALKSLSYEGSGISDQGFTVLGSIKTLEGLYLRGTLFGDEAMAALDGLPQLKGLHLEKTAVTDAGLGRMKSLPNLEQLYLDNTQVGQLDPALGNFGFAGVSTFPKLKILGLSGTHMRDECFAQLPKCERLETLIVTDVSLTPDSCQSLAECKELKNLTLASPTIQGRHLREIARSKSLQYLYIRRSSIGKEDFTVLKQIPNLKTCVIFSDAISTEEIRKTLVNLLPGVVLDISI